jgi:hypothetical protein
LRSRSGGTAARARSSDYLNLARIEVRAELDVVTHGLGYRLAAVGPARVICISFAGQRDIGRRFVEPPTPDVDRFHEALKSSGWTALETGTSTVHCGRGHYEGEVAYTDEHHSYVNVVTIGDDHLRLFPHDDYIPPIDELIGLIEAIDIGLDSPLTHDPIECKAIDYATIPMIGER